MTVQRLNHVAYRCRDAEETTAFYVDVLGLRLAHTIVQDRVPSTQEYAPHAHVFFEMGDGSWVAFFDVSTEEHIAQETNPDWAQHLALEVDSTEVLAEKKALLEQHGVDVLGPVDHGFIQSIYFYDPNGHRLELAARTYAPGDLERFARTARDDVRAWTRRKAEQLSGTGA
jgi:catechol 2,3-dioxygenase-like lactoylglutathione lyase family enzyme